MKNSGRILGFVCFVLLAGTTNITPGAEPRSNLSILEEIMDSTLVELWRNGIFTGDDSLRVVIIARDSIFSGVLQSYLHHMLLNKYHQLLFAPSQKKNPVGKRITFRWLDWQILYRPVKHKFWRKNKVQRNLHADYFVEVVNEKNNKILFSKHFQKDYSDIIAGDRMEGVQNRNYGFTVGILQKQPGFLKNWLEPVFLFAISGTVVYLFYSVRSK